MPLDPRPPLHEESDPAPDWAVELSRDVRALKDCIIGTTEKPGLVARMSKIEEWAKGQGGVQTKLFIIGIGTIITLLLQHLINGG